jgi:hypothetical protein
MTGDMKGPINDFQTMLVFLVVYMAMMLGTVYLLVKLLK